MIKLIASQTSDGYELETLSNAHTPIKNNGEHHVVTSYFFYFKLN